MKLPQHLWHIPTREPAQEHGGWWLAPVAGSPAAPLPSQRHSDAARPARATAALNKPPQIYGQFCGFTLSSRSKTTTVMPGMKCCQRGRIAWGCSHIPARDEAVQRHPALRDARAHRHRSGPAGCSAGGRDRQSKTLPRCQNPSCSPQAMDPETLSRWKRNNHF